MATIHRLKSSHFQNQDIEPSGYNVVRLPVQHNVAVQSCKESSQMSPERKRIQVEVQ